MTTGILPRTATTPDSERLPAGFRVEVARDIHLSRNRKLLLGGCPPRLMRLSAAAANLVATGTITVHNGQSARLARKLLDAGVAHPRPPRAPAASVSVVIPVRDRPDALARLLRALREDPDTSAVPVLVVDDGSRDAGTCQAVAGEYGAQVVRHEHSRGPSAARNSGLRATNTEHVVFCDSDVVPQPGWLPLLLDQFTDPAVALAAPRIVALSGRESPTAIAAFDEACSPLDLGPDEAPIVPMSQVAYVPSAAIVLRRSAAPAGFAEELRVAEDVDLCMRLHEAGWRLRYVPSAHVAHDHRKDLASWLRQRAFYGSGAAILSRRHHGDVPPMYVTAWSLFAVVLALTGRPWALTSAAGLTATAAIRVVRKLPEADRPMRTAILLSFAGLASTATQLLRAAARHHWPVALVLMLLSRRARRLILLGTIADALIEHHRTGSKLHPLKFIALRRLDDLAYGTGVWWGVLRHRTPGPLLPRISGFESVRRPLSRLVPLRFPGPSATSQ